MSAVLEFQYELTRFICPVCCIPYAIPETMSAERYRNGGDWFCPNGHKLHYATPEVDKLRKELETVKTEAARKIDSAWQTANTATSKLREVEQERDRERKRAANGVCPCCKRSFKALRRHMDRKHPEYGGDASKTSARITAEDSTRAISLDKNRKIL